MESWREIQGWEGFYEVSDEGRIKRVAPSIFGRWHQPAGHILAPHVIKSGYRMVRLCRRTEEKCLRVCRIVLRVFSGEPPTPQHQANHINGNKADDRASNLEWVTPQQNCRHAYDVLGVEKPRGEKHHHARLTAAIIAEARELITAGWRHREVAERFGVARSTISGALRGTNWGHLRD